MGNMIKVTFYGNTPEWDLNSVHDELKRFKALFNPETVPFSIYAETDEVSFVAPEIVALMIYDYMKDIIEEDDIDYDYCK